MQAEGERERDRGREKPHLKHTKQGEGRKECPKSEAALT